MANMVVACVTVKKVGRVPSVTLQNTTVRCLTVQDMDNVWVVCVFVELAGKAHSVNKWTAQIPHAQDMVHVLVENVTAKLAGRASIALQ